MREKYSSPAQEHLRADYLSAFPRRRSECPQPEKREVRRESPLRRHDGTAFHILIAEDNDANSQLLVTLMERRGWRATAVPDGGAALEAVRGGKFDLILMDVQMPVMDGLQATRQIRALAQPFCDTPIIGLTAHALEEGRSRCIAAGMDEYLSKPVFPRILYAAIEKMLESKASETSECNSSRRI